MSTDVSDAPPQSPRGHPVIAWVVIAAAVAGLALLRLFLQPPAETRQMDALELQARFLVGAANLGPKPPELYKQVQDFNQGPAGQRLRFVILAGELKGPAEAVARLDELQEQMSKGEVPETDPQNVGTAETLGRLYRDYDKGDLSAPDVGAEDRRGLRQRLGWFGDLALNPAGGPDRAARAAVVAPARRAVVFLFGIALAGLGGGAVGLALLVLFFILWRRMHSRFAVGSPYGGVYAETFALWLVVFIVLSLAVGFLPENVPHELVGGAAGLVSLCALAWPVLRGVPWRRVRDDIGLWPGDRPFLEPFYGVVCYLAALPIVIACMLVLLGVLQLGQKWGGHDLFGPGGGPTHPIVYKVLHSGWWGGLQALFAASVVAPIMEETMFRGVLYRHVREASQGLGRWWSVVVSALTASFVFAALHPQGLLAIPVLMALALGFSAAREWRGSLIPSMTVHALHNGVLMLMLILAAG